MAERLQKILANTGLGSRRELETWIAAGEVNRNGQTAKLGDRAEVDDNLTVRGRYYRVVSDDAASSRVIAYHKPDGEISTRSDPERRRTVFERLPRLHDGRWISVGRLDINTLGLLLLTTDGQLAHGLMHPSRQVEREYAVRVNGRVSDAMLEHLRNGVQLEDGMASFDRVWADEQHRDSANNWFRVIVREGRNQWLARGKFANLDDDQIADLRLAAGLKESTAQSNTLKAVPVHPRHKRKAKARRRARA